MTPPAGDLQPTSSTSTTSEDQFEEKAPFEEGSMGKKAVSSIGYARYVLVILLGVYGETRKVHENNLPLNFGTRATTDVLLCTPVAIFCFGDFYLAAFRNVAISAITGEIITKMR